MAEENDDNVIKPEIVELENGLTMENYGQPQEEACDNSIDQEEVEPDNGEEERSVKLVEETTIQGDLKNNCDLPVDEVEIENPSPPKEKDSADSHVGRKPTVVIVGSNHKFNVRSRYLSSSFSSCHDLCKYGHKHGSEQNTKQPLLGTIREGQPLVRTSNDDLATTVINKQAKKKEFLRRLSLPGPAAQKDPKPRIEVMSPSKRDVNKSKLKRIQGEVKPSSSSTPKYAGSGSKNEAHAGKKTIVRSSTMPQSSSQGVKEIKTRKEIGSHSRGEKEKGKDLSNSLSPKTPLKRSPSVKARLVKNLRSSSHSRDKSDLKEAESNGTANMPEKTSQVNEPGTVRKPTKRALKTTLPKENSPSTPRGSRVSKTKEPKGNKKGNRVGNSSSSAASAPMSTGSATKDPSQSLEENQRALDSMKPKPVATAADDSGSKANTPRAKSTADRKKIVKKTGTNRPEEKDGSTWKVKFKRGTVVALQVANSAPKKLRFKRGRVLGEDQSAKDEGCKSLKGQEATGKEMHDTSTEPGKVQLRHQEASGKKDSVDLNNVIEETASKLAKTRKSKVKALVGAFDTVMSLRDRKPLVETGAS